jgi:hypothetical protein
MMNKNMLGQSDAKKIYAMPQIRTLGDVRTLTKAGGSGVRENLNPSGKNCANNQAPGACIP